MSVHVALLRDAMTIYMNVYTQLCQQEAQLLKNKFSKRFCL